MADRAQASIRAKTVLKIDTGHSNLDYTYNKGTSMDDVFKNVAHAVVFNKGKTAAQEFFNEFMASYDEGWRDPESS